MASLSPQKKKIRKEPAKKTQSNKDLLTPVAEEDIYGVNIAEEMQIAKAAVDEDKTELLAFKLSNEEYVLDINSIKEIIRPVEITKVPRVPSHIKGIISLRGVIVPVYDLKNRLRLLEADAADNSQKRILILNFDEELVGITVDAVTGVVKIKEDIIEPTPQIIKGVDAEYLKGVARIDNRLLIILNLERILRKDA